MYKSDSLIREELSNKYINDLPLETKQWHLWLSYGNFLAGGETSTDNQLRTSVWLSDCLTVWLSERMKIKLSPEINIVVVE